MLLIFQIIKNALHDPYVQGYLATVLGCTVMFMFSLYKGFEGSEPALRHLWPGKSDVFYARLDFLIMIVFGSIVGSIFFQPKGALQGLSAGCGWVGALNVLTNKNVQRQMPEVANRAGERT